MAVAASSVASFS